MPSKKAVQSSEAVVSPKAARKRAAVKAIVAAPATTRKKAAVAADTPVAAVTHRHKKEPISSQRDAAASAGAPAYEPSNEEVAKLAYSYYVARGHQGGDQADDWFRAVTELKSRHDAPPA